MRLVSTELADAVRSGVAALLRYKLRTTLSVLGVVLGVAGVVAMVSVGEGARRQTLAQVQALGSGQHRGPQSAAQRAGFDQPGLRVADAARVRDLVPAVAFASPLTERHVRLHGTSTPTSTPVLGVGSQFGAVLRLRMASGRFLSAVDERQGAAVCVVGDALASRLRRRTWTPARQARSPRHVSLPGDRHPAGLGTRHDDGERSGVAQPGRGRAGAVVAAERSTRGGRAGAAHRRDLAADRRRRQRRTGR